jgi:hypothetical protein
VIAFFQKPVEITSRRVNWLLLNWANTDLAKYITVETEKNEERN